MVIPIPKTTHTHTHTDIQELEKAFRHNVKIPMNRPNICLQNENQSKEKEKKCRTTDVYIFK